jgi:hypothetical protein
MTAFRRLAPAFADEAIGPTAMSRIHAALVAGYSAPAGETEVRADAFRAWNFTVALDNIGQANGFSNRFIVIVDDDAWLAGHLPAGGEGGATAPALEG